MCLLIEARCASCDREVLEAAARAASTAGLQVNVAHASRLQSASNRPVRATISEDGGCACSLLTDEEAEGTWSIRPEMLDAFSTTLEMLASQGPPSLAVEALWVGDKPEQTVEVSPRELGILARHNRLGTRTRYSVVKDAG
jgi:hypothetical protein